MTVAGMRKILNSTLIADGRSDRVLIPIIATLLQTHSPQQFRETDFVQEFPSSGLNLSERIDFALRERPCDLLFVHRDAERADGLTSRVREIERAVAALGILQTVVCVVPVRMTEAWLICDEHPIRCAAGNPTGRSPLGLPELNQVESVDAKELLFDALVRAKNLGRRRANGLNPASMRSHVADYLDDMDRLRRLPSFRRFESSVRQILSNAPFVDA